MTNEAEKYLLRCYDCDLDLVPLSITVYVWACPRCNFRRGGNGQFEWWDQHAKAEVMRDDSGYLIDA